LYELTMTEMNAMADTRSRGHFGLVPPVVFALLILSAACRVNPTSPDLENSPAGKACPPDAKIEDGEDNNNQILVQDGRSGKMGHMDTNPERRSRYLGTRRQTKSPGGSWDYTHDEQEHPGAQPGRPWKGARFGEDTACPGTPHPGHPDPQVSCPADQTAR
jgi:hypothetical protein